MPLRKTAIALPAELLAEIDRAAHTRQESRNGFITRVLETAVRARRDADVTRRLNELLADPDTSQEQLRTTAELDAAGTDWSDERW